MLSPYLDRPGADAALRLFCFHHAGGGSSMYRPWHRALHPYVSVWPVQLPGRERRAAETRFVDVEALVTEMESELEDVLTVPHLFFGHSLGALVAYRLACRRRAEKRPLPLALLVSGYSAPHLPAPFPPVDGLEDTTLVQFLSDVGGVPTELLAWPEWMRHWLPLVRDDLHLCCSYDDPDDPPLACPMHLFGADADPLVSETDLRAWNRHTTQPCGVHILPGDHFYLTHAPEQLFRVLRPLLRRYATATGRDGAVATC
ncbi:thioesterase II family protein [Rhodococcus tibetensis]|uniref:Thioesterase TesA n=1 Tax=Rhodococcus tibetensis TaxID=2965064 RepID=A0ABT1Q8D5_9NOCA|nr:alpha/beta fold hydrolase [Rhodococcus sp. FXJ9.536]MCQ4118501.1 alpha/beta fold hydrolase [Rhodococcus sp. FXJ9.536]